MKVGIHFQVRQGRRAALCTIFFTIFGLQAYAVNATEYGQCGASELRAGPILGLTHELRLGAPVLFDDGVGINSGLCFPLSDGDEFISWVHALHKAGPRLYLQRCEELTMVKGISPDSRGGAIAEQYVRVEFDTEERPVFTELSAPAWSGYANPAFCGTRIAYWGLHFRNGQSAQVDAIVMDLTDRHVVRQVVLGSAVLESDSRDFFERPRWNANGKAVSFCGRCEGSADAQVRVGSRRLYFGPDRAQAPTSPLQPECN